MSIYGENLEEKWKHKEGRIKIKKENGHDDTLPWCWLLAGRGDTDHSCPSPPIYSSQGQGNQGHQNVGVIVSLD